MLRKLYQTFGHLFCHSATLGGCLQTTKIVSGTEQTAQSKEKESFKASVGVAFSTVSRNSHASNGAGKLMFFAARWHWW